MIKINYCLGAAMVLLMAGCASVAPVPQSGGGATPVTPGVASTPQEVTAEAAPVVPRPVMSKNQAVVALLDKAQLDNGAGQREAAGASLERALRIEPRNPWLWHELAQLRLSQGQYAQAISLAKKSSSFAGQERRLLALNWRVIANAHVAQGNISQAEQAFKQAETLEQ